QGRVHHARNEGRHARSTQDRGETREGKEHRAFEGRQRQQPARVLFQPHLGGRDEGREVVCSVFSGASRVLPWSLAPPPRKNCATAQFFLTSGALAGSQGWSTPKALRNPWKRTRRRNEPWKGAGTVSSIGFRRPSRARRHFASRTRGCARCASLTPGYQPTP